MRDDLIKQITALKNINHVVVLTHNIDFVFLQTVFLSALKQCGHPGLTLFADAQCARESYRFQSSMITGLGRRFRVVPVSMNTGFRFHPKAVFLVGDDQSVLFVGSGNMTFGGMRENAEIWNRFDTTEGDFQSIAAFREYLFEVSGRVAFKDAVKSEFMELFDEQKYEWVNELGEAGGLVGRVGDSESLESQMQKIIGDQPVSKITVSTPYFDPKADALKTLSENNLNPNIEVLIQSGQSTLLSEAAKNLPSNIELKSIGFSDLKEDGEIERRFIHAKIYAFHRSDEVDVFAGSANCSRAALLKSGTDGNAELMIHQSMDSKAFDQDILNEYIIVDSDPELINHDDIEQEDSFNPGIQILAARFDISLLKVAYVLSKNIELTACLVDNIECDYEIHNECEIWVRTVSIPSSILLKGISEGTEIISNSIWVDEDSSLRSTSKGRALLERIRNSDSSNGMQADDWALIVELFAKDLEYTTAKELLREKSEKQGEKDKEESVITRSDVFADTYDKAPDFSGHLMGSLGSESANIYSLLLNAFGITSIQDATTPELNDNNNNEDTVDTPTTIKKKAEDKTKSEEIPDRTRKRISKVINAITESFTNQSYLELRDPERLGTDLQIAGLVLRKALSEGWIDGQQYFDVTQKIWSILFFTIKKDEPVGWLGVRYKQAKDKNKFVLAISSPQLAATLFAWAIAVDMEIGGAYAQRFLSSLLLSMGRYPWLWHDGINQDDLYIHLMKILEDSPCGVDGMVDIESLHQQRISLLRQGVALAQMENALSHQDIIHLRDRIKNKEASRGEILWQGKRGICISLKNTADSGPNVKVLCLQDPDGDTSFMKEYLIPVRQIIDPEVLPDTEEFGEVQRKEVVRVMQRLSAIENLDC